MSFVTCKTQHKHNFVSHCSASVGGLGFYAFGATGGLNMNMNMSMNMNMNMT